MDPMEQWQMDLEAQEYLAEHDEDTENQDEQP